MNVDPKNSSPAAGSHHRGGGLRDGSYDRTIMECARGRAAHYGRQRARKCRTQPVRNVDGRARSAIAEAGPNADNPTASFAALKGREADVVAHQARLADLIVVPHPASDKEVSSSDALHAVLFDSAKPVLIAPRTAASAVLAAFPWLKRAQSIRILWSDDYQRRGPLAPDLEQYLAAHDITVDQAPFSAINNVVRRRAAGSGRQFCL